MDTNFQVIERKPNSLSSNEAFFKNEDGQMEHVSVEELLESESLVNEKNKKKKKKHKGSLQSPKQILAFNTSKLVKLDQQKAEMRRCFTGSSRILSKCPSFPVNSTLKAVLKGAGDSQSSKEYATSSPDKISMLSRVSSLPLKSALRGSSQELGIGPRPKLHVKWDSSVWEPPCSTISHTVIKNYPKKKGPIRGCSGKFNGTDLCMKQNCKKAQNGKLKFDSSTHVNILGDSSCEQSSQDGDKNVNLSMQNDGLKQSSYMVVGNSESDGSHVSKELARHNSSDEADKEPAALGVQYALTCGGLFFVDATVSCSFLYGEVL